MRMIRSRRSWIAPSFILTLFVAFSYLWLSGSDASKQADLAANGVAGSIVALAILILERSLNRSQERHRQITLFATNPSGSDFRGADLHVAYASGQDLSGCILSKANLRNARLAEVHHRPGAAPDFSRADLRGADISAGDLSQADFANADLRSADLGAISLSGANLSDADLRRARMFFRGPGGPLEGADLSGAALFGADLRDIALVVRDRAHAGHVVGVALGGAWSNEETRWPTGFDPTAAGVTMLPGKERRLHDYNVAWKDPGFDDVTTTTSPGAWVSHTHDSGRERYPYGYQWHVLSEALATMQSDLESIRIALTGEDSDINSD
jgi:uncharacterized protein YjbI with pentapeptide repeats